MDSDTKIPVRAYTYTQKGRARAKIEKNLREFLDYWFAGLLQGLEGLDEPSQSKVLHECGKACARSYTAQVFREAKQDSADMDTFLQALSRGFPEASYERVGSDVIRVTYARCGCDLVRLGWSRPYPL
jgi:hypothetical protein